MPRPRPVFRPSAIVKPPDSAKLDTRRKVILGGALLDLAERDSTAATMLDRLIRNLPREQDRRAFTDWDASGSSASPAPGSDADNPS